MKFAGISQNFDEHSFMAITENGEVYEFIPNYVTPNSPGTWIKSGDFIEYGLSLMGNKNETD